ncbi:prolyl oligopeptidase family serine peptidase [candidate division KSB1 bacterium]
MKKIFLFTLIAVFSISSAGRTQTGPSIPGPSFRDVLSLNSVSGPRISPDGRSIIYTVRSIEWDNNRYDTEIWLARTGDAPFQLTRTNDGSSSSPEWSPDGTWISFTADRGNGTQLYLINEGGGEAMQLTDHKGGVGSYRWSPDGSQIAFTAADTLSADMETREELYGRFEVEDAEYRMQHLWITDVMIEGAAKETRFTSGHDFTVGSFSWSPDGSNIAFDHRPDPLINSSVNSDISILDVESGRIRPLVTQPGSDAGPRWSPDGRWIVFSTKMGDTRFYTNSEMAVIRASGGDISVITESFDENLSFQEWTSKGIYCLANQKTFRHLFLLDPEQKTVRKIADLPENINSISFTGDENTIALHGYDRRTLPEIYRTSISSYRPVSVTDMTGQVSGWAAGSREIVEWKSKDGTVIDGVLWKPDNYEAGRKYPLLVIIHGGPSSVSRPSLVSGGVYPYLQWLARGALILQPNYRGSTGYGEQFRSLNVRNLGVGDAWDVESGVDFLIDEGMVDEDRVGAMGWSQGGYISAFLTTTSKKFKAISVGAGISNWMTYYVNTDIHPFTRHYLQGDPWNDPEIYAKTSPMTYIKQSQTPTLIQHGEFDQRVPIPNAFELFQGLQDMNIETKLIVYKDFGHGISRPKEQLAAMWHNWQWFAKYIWNEEVDTPLKK